MSKGGGGGFRTLALEPFGTLGVTATERRGNNLKGFEDFRLKNGSRQCQIWTLTVLMLR